RTVIVRLLSTAQTGYFYTRTRVRMGPKLSAVKYDPTVQRRVLFVESRKSGKKTNESVMVHRYSLSYRFLTQVRNAG
ncbi:hypothetical protein B0H10DRAFT_1834181, partial [Mycena sp. CBHHK59/15]